MFGSTLSMSCGHGRHRVFGALGHRSCYCNLLACSSLRRERRCPPACLRLSRCTSPTMSGCTLCPRDHLGRVDKLPRAKRMSSSRRGTSSCVCYRRRASPHSCCLPHQGRLEFPATPFGQLRDLLLLLALHHRRPRRMTLNQRMLPQFYRYSK